MKLILKRAVLLTFLCMPHLHVSATELTGQGAPSNTSFSGEKVNQIQGEVSRSDPFALMQMAMFLFNNGKKEDAVFWFYAGQLRARYAPDAQGENAQVVTVYISVGSPINAYAMRDVPNLNLTIQRVLTWDEQTFQDWAWERSIDIRADAILKQRARAREGLSKLADILAANKDEYERAARSAPTDARIPLGSLPAATTTGSKIAAAEPVRSLYLRDADPSTSRRLGNVEIVPQRALIEGKDASYWVQRYYEWLEKNKSKFRYQDGGVQKDATGSLCASMQNGPVWFLTNFQWGKVTRACEIPADVYVLIPVLEALIVPAAGTLARCDDLAATARKLATEDSKAFLAVDGQELKEIRSFEGAISCIEKDDPTLAGERQIAASHGFWVFLKPLSRGTHRIQFKGGWSQRNYISQMELAYDVSYEIAVKP